MTFAVSPAILALMSKVDMSALGEGKLEDERLAALVEVMVLAAHADGEFSEGERTHFEKAVESLTDGRIGGAPLSAAVAATEKALAAEGRKRRLAAVKARLPDEATRRIALSLAIQVTAADDFIRTSERELILETAEALEIDRAAAADMVKQLDG